MGVKKVREFKVDDAKAKRGVSVATPIDMPGTDRDEPTPDDFEGAAWMRDDRAGNRSLQGCVGERWARRGR